MKVIRKITEKDNLSLKEFVQEVINEERKDKNNLAAYINCYRQNEIDYIYINIIRGDLSTNQLVLWQSFDNSIIIKKQYIPKLTFNQCIDNGIFKDLSNGTIILDNNDGEYTRLQKEIIKNGFIDYNLTDYVQVEFDPPLNIKKIKRRRKNLCKDSVKIIYYLFFI